MAYDCKVLTDSLNARLHRPYRLTTFEITFPRMVLAEFNTHTILSRNSASSRAIPVKTQLRRVMEDPYIPFYWGKNVPGMQAPEEIPANRKPEAIEQWLAARNRAVVGALFLLLGKDVMNNLIDINIAKRPMDNIGPPTVDELSAELLSILDNLDGILKELKDEILNVHKQLVNRLLEPFMWHTVITTGTEWDNFLALRCDNNAQPEIRVIAEMMRDLYGKELPGDSESNRMQFAPYRTWADAGHTPSMPTELGLGEWHTPLLSQEQIAEYGIDTEQAKLVSVGRCARVSYMTHEGRVDWVKDIELALSLLKNGHMSPFQHVGTPMAEIGHVLMPNHQSGDVDQFEYDWSGNFRGWHQMRKLLPHEYDFTEVREIEFAEAA